MVTLKEADVDKLFKDSVCQAQIILGLHAMAVPNWDQVDRMIGHPGVNKDTWMILSQRCASFDRVHHPKLTAGLAWDQTGFTCMVNNAELEDWDVSMEETIVIYKV